LIRYVVIFSIKFNQWV